MAQAPYLLNINTFDSKNEKTFVFRFDGEQISGSKLTIRKNQTNEVVYSGTQNGLLLQHTLPANTIQNNQLYNADIVVFAGGNTSIKSNTIVFHCFSTPTDQRFVDLPPTGKVIKNASYNFKLAVTNTVGDDIAAYYVVLYDAHHREVYNSGVKYDKTYVVFIDGLADNQQYYIKGFFETIHGLEFSTEEYQFSVDYINPSNYNLFQLENIKHQGMIKLSSQIISIDGKSSGNISFIDNAKVDLRGNGEVYFDDLLLTGDFLIDIRGHSFVPYADVFEIRSGNNKIKLKYIQAKYENQTDTVAFFALSINGNGLTHYCYSNYFDPSKNQSMLQVTIVRNNGLYNLDVITS